MNEMINMSNNGRGKHRVAGAVDPNSQISRKLREFYEGVQEESIPDRFLDLLEKLDEAEKSVDSAGKNDKQ